MANCKQGRDSVNTYYHRLKKLWQELQHYMKLPTSKATALINKKREEEEVYQFLMGLNDSANSTTTQVSSKKSPLPKLRMSLIEYVEKNSTKTSHVWQQLKKKTAAMEEAFVITKAPSNLASQRPTCAHCHKQGHNMTSYYQLHGFSKG